MAIVLLSIAVRYSCVLSIGFLSTSIILFLSALYVSQSGA